MDNDIGAEDLAFLREAARFFDEPSSFLKAFDWLGSRFERAQKLIPARARELIHDASKNALAKALDVSLATIPPGQASGPETARRSRRMHLGAASAVGGLGGFFGFASLPAELPLVTVLMFRAIAEIARDAGEDLSTSETRLECLYVFSLGSESSHDDALAPSYYASRLAFAELARGAAPLLSRGLLAALDLSGAPVVARLIASIATSFEVRVAEKALAQATPLIGAVGGAAINAAFTHHFQEAARYHFGLRRLERVHGFEKTRAAFEALRARRV
jgi:hypothetical protein